MLSKLAAINASILHHYTKFIPYSQALRINWICSENVFRLSRKLTLFKARLEVKRLT